MGLDIYIDKVRKPEIKEDGNRTYAERKELCYWRKFYGIINEAIPFKYGDEEYGKDIRLKKEDVEKILDYACHHRDYFDGFDSVPSICKLLDEWDEIEEDDWKIVFNANW